MSVKQSAAAKARWARMSPEQRLRFIRARASAGGQAAAESHRNRATKATGSKRGSTARIVIALDPETFETVRKRAVENGVSFAEEARTLIEWGLEA